MHRVLLVLLALAWATIGCADPEAEALLQSVRRALPDMPVRLAGQLQSRDANGRLEGSLQVEARLQLEAQEPRATYLLKDAFGGTLQSISIHRQTNGTMDFEFQAGNPLQAAPPPPLAAPIENTGISWSDLSFAFLWWPEPKIIGSEKIKNRLCRVVEVAAPADEAAAQTVRLWIEPQFLAVMRAETYDQDARPLKRLEVKSIKKLHSIWMIKDLEVRDLQTQRQTQLRVRHMDMEAPELTPEQRKELAEPVPM